MIQFGYYFLPCGFLLIATTHNNHSLTTGLPLLQVIAMVRSSNCLKILFLGLVWHQQQAAQAFLQPGGESQLLALPVVMVV